MPEGMDSTAMHAGGLVRIDGIGHACFRSIGSVKPANVYLVWKTAVQKEGRFVLQIGAEWSRGESGVSTGQLHVVHDEVTEAGRCV